MRMQADGVKLNYQFRETQIEHFFSNLSAEDLSDDFDPFKLREKWMRFFRGGLQRPELDADRVLKNQYTHLQADYINDHILTFNDN